MGLSSRKKREKNLRGQAVRLTRIAEQSLSDGDACCDSMLAVILELEAGKTYTSEELTAAKASVTETKQALTHKRAQVTSLRKNLEELWGEEDS